MHSVSEALYGGLEYITVPGGKARGTSMQRELVDGVLHLLVDYGSRIIEEKSAGTKMRTLKQEAKFKDG